MHIALSRALAVVIFVALDVAASGVKGTVERTQTGLLTRVPGFPWTGGVGRACARTPSSTLLIPPELWTQSRSWRISLLVLDDWVRAQARRHRPVHGTRVPWLTAPFGSVPRCPFTPEAATSNATKITTRQRPAQRQCACRQLAANAWFHMGTTTSYGANTPLISVGPGLPADTNALAFQVGSVLTKFGRQHYLPFPHRRHQQCRTNYGADAVRYDCAVAHWAGLCPHAQRDEQLRRDA